MSRPITVVVSQGPSHHPAKRRLEETLVARLLGEAAIEVMVLPHLYDLPPDSPGRLGLAGIQGDMIVCGWLYPRALYWVLDQYGIRGRMGATRIRGLDEEEEADDAELEEAGSGQGASGAGRSAGEHAAGEDTADGADRAERGNRSPGTGRDERPARTIYCLDLRAEDSVDAYIEEILRLAREASVETVALTDWKSPPGSAASLVAPLAPAAAAGDAAPPRRWYPVIDFSRCTNCLECIDFCLFGVYGIDGVESIVVEQPDNCRKGCPACSRVCPENAIIFPQHKSPAIAGSKDQAASMKVDLSQLFGAPDAQAIAARERDEQLLLAGREAVGNRPTAAPEPPGDSRPACDALDALIDAVDQFDV